jgi:hypothetical protein
LSLLSRRRSRQKPPHPRRPCQGFLSQALPPWRNPRPRCQQSSQPFRHLPLPSLPFLHPKRLMPQALSRPRRHPRHLPCQSHRCPHHRRLSWRPPRLCRLRHRQAPPSLLRPRGRQLPRPRPLLLPNL